MIPSLTPAQSEAIVRCLAEVQPGTLGACLAMGWDGVTVQTDDATMWYFDTTWGGDDGPNDEGRLRVYVNVEGEYGHLGLHDAAPPDAPTLGSDPLEVARWIVDVIAAGVPPCNP